MMFGELEFIIALWAVGALGVLAMLYRDNGWPWS